MLDDEQDLINVMREGLKRYGFNVYGFIDPLLALDFFKTSAGLVTWLFQTLEYLR